MERLVGRDGGWRSFVGVEVVVLGGEMSVEEVDSVVSVVEGRVSVIVVIREPGYFV